VIVSAMAADPRGTVYYLVFGRSGLYRLADTH